MSKKKFSGSIGGKGYYIALVLCAVAIGITGFLYYRNADPKDVSLQDPTDGVNQVDQMQNDDVQVVATQPEGSEDPTTVPTVAPENVRKPEKTSKPLAGNTVAEYSMDALCYNQTTRDWRVHDGMDIAGEVGAQVCAAADGTVYTVYEDEAMGMTVVIRHDGGYTTTYASLAENVSVKAGDTVTAGQAIGTVGATALLESAVGEHVHFSVSCNGKLVDPKDFLS